MSTLIKQTRHGWMSDRFTAASSQPDHSSPCTSLARESLWAASRRVAWIQRGERVLVVEQEVKCDAPRVSLWAAHSMQDAGAGGRWAAGTTCSPARPALSRLRVAYPRNARSRHSALQIPADASLAGSWTRWQGFQVGLFIGRGTSRLVFSSRFCIAGAIQSPPRYLRFLPTPILREARSSTWSADARQNLLLPSLHVSNLGILEQLLYQCNNLDWFLSGYKHHFKRAADVVTALVGTCGERNPSHALRNHILFSLDPARNLVWTSMQASTVNSKDDHIPPELSAHVAQHGPAHRAIASLLCLSHTLLRYSTISRKQFQAPLSVLGFNFNDGEIL